MAAVTMAAAAVAGVAVSAVNANKANKTAKAAQRGQEQILSRQQDIADEQWKNYKQNYLPLEQDYLEQAKNFGSIANQEKAAANAAATTAGRFAGAREQLAKTPGLNPNSQQYLREANKLAIAEAASSAANQNAAREGVEKTGAAMLQDAASLGKGMSSNAMSSLNAAASGTAAQANTAASNAAAARNNVGGAFSAIGGLYKSGAFDGLSNLFSPAPVSQYSLSTGVGSSAVDGVGLTSGGGYGLSSGGGLGLQAPTGW